MLLVTHNVAFYLPHFLCTIKRELSIGLEVSSSKQTINTDQGSLGLGVSTAGYKAPRGYTEHTEETRGFPFTFLNHKVEETSCGTEEIRLIKIENSEQAKAIQTSHQTYFCFDS
jgi:hypothetical protein